MIRGPSLCCLPASYVLNDKVDEEGVSRLFEDVDCKCLDSK